MEFTALSDQRFFFSNQNLKILLTSSTFRTIIREHYCLEVVLFDMVTICKASTCS